MSLFVMPESVKRLQSTCFFVACSTLSVNNNFLCGYIAANHKKYCIFEAHLC